MYSVPPPKTTTIRRHPVTYAGAGQMNNLTGCMLPDGRALLVWVIFDDGAASGIYCKEVTDDRVWVTNGAVDHATEGVAVDLGGPTYSASCFAHDGDVFISMMRSFGSGAARTGRQVLLIADDPNNPEAGWSTYSTIQSTSIGDRSFVMNTDPDVWVAGIPYIDGDTWIYTGGVWQTSTGDVERTAESGLWRSTDGGVTWTNKIEQAYGSGGRYTPPHITKDPATGDLYWSTVGDGDTGHLWKSTDGGDSWSVVTVYGGSEPAGTGRSYFGATIYGGESYVIHRVMNATDTRSVDFSGSWPTFPGYAHHLALLGEGNSHGRACLGTQGIYLFDSDSVQDSAVAVSGGWRLWVSES